MFHHESWKPIYFGVKMSKVKVTSRQNIAGVGLCTLVSASFFFLSSSSLLFCHVFLRSTKLLADVKYFYGVIVCRVEVR